VYSLLEIRRLVVASPTREVPERGNFGCEASDYLDMDCDLVRTALSADLDGEALPIDREAVARHVEGCPACQAFETQADALHRLVRLRAAVPVPDLSDRVLAAIDAEAVGPASSGTLGLRFGVAVVGLLQLGLAVPAMVLGSQAGFPVHAARDLGAFGVALAVGLLFAAWKPERVGALLPLATVLVLCLVAASVLDVSTGHATADSEVGHLVEVIGLAGLWLLHRNPDTEPTEPTPGRKHQRVPRLHPA
jgi:predicted anti-sigma-YlaC factor YlaD